MPRDDSLYATKLRRCVCGQFLLPGLVPRPGPALEAAISLWLDVGNLEPLEQALLAGYGHMLEGRSSRLPRVAAFLRNLPLYQGRIARVHEAAAQGQLTELARLLDHEGETWAVSRDQAAGTTPLQKAMLGKHYATVRLLLRRAPCCRHATDRMGRAPLHYAAALDATSDTSVTKWYQILLDAGCEENIKDSLGRTPQFYKERCTELLQYLDPHDSSDSSSESSTSSSSESTSSSSSSSSSSSEDSDDSKLEDDDTLIIHVTVEIHEEDVTSQNSTKIDERPPAQAA